VTMASDRDPLVGVLDIGDVFGQSVACFAQRHGSHTASLAKNVGKYEPAECSKPRKGIDHRH